MLQRMIDFLFSKKKSLFHSPVEEMKKQGFAESDFDLGHKENLFDQGKIFEEEKNKNDVIKPVEKYIEHKLIVRLRDKEQTTFTFTRNLNIKDKSFPFKEFFKWYLTKENPFFVYEYDDGSMVFKRSDIKYVQRQRNIRLLEKPRLDS